MTGTVHLCRYNPDRTPNGPSCPERPAYGDRMHRAELMAEKTHAAEVALLREDAVAFYGYKNAHRAEVHAPVLRVAVPAPPAQVRIDVHFHPNRCCRADLHGYSPILSCRLRKKPAMRRNKIIQQSIIN